MQVMTLGVMADPALPEKVARSAAKRLRKELGETGDGGPGGRWCVEISGETLPLDDEGEIPLAGRAESIRSDHGWDYVVYLTDLPFSHEDGPMLCEVAPDARAALVSLPALCVDHFALKARKLVVALLGSIGGVESHAAKEAIGRAIETGKVHWIDGPEGKGVSYIVLPGGRNRLRLLAGMVLSNRPGRLLKALASCVAAAMATGAFGIFYAAIWNMSDALSAGRLALISVLVISALTAWLVFHNQLWDRSARKSDYWRARLDNASTIITVAISVVMMYGLLWAGLFLIGLVVIDAGYLQEQLRHSVTLLDYASLSWLAASLGTLAGALGSNFDGDSVIREATYSRREHQRRQMSDSYKD